MTSGRKLTDELVSEILRLAGERDEGGRYRRSYVSIAETLDLHPRTVSRQIRLAAVAWGKHMAWRASEISDF